MSNEWSETVPYGEDLHDIAKEMCAVWLERVGYITPLDPVPSPVDLETWAATI